MPTMNRAFSLIEVIISVVLLATSAIALLQIMIQSKHTIGLSNNLEKNLMYLSIPLNHGTKDYHGTSKKITEYLVGEYNLGDATKSDIKEIEILYKEKILSNEIFTIDEENSINIQRYLLSVSYGTVEFSELGFAIQ